MTTFLQFPVKTNGQGLYEVTHEIQTLINQSDFEDGLCNVFIQHTSASLLIQENADPSARKDLESWIKRTVPERDPHYTHIYEGDDDMPAHIKAAITNSDLTIPVQAGNLLLGTWQGIYLWEHRTSRHDRRLIITLN